MDSLSKLFGSEAKVKIMRLFLFNPASVYGSAEIVSRTKVRGSTTRSELRILEKAKMIKKRSIRMSKKRISGWILNTDFSYLVPLQNLLMNISSLKKDHILKKLNKLGRLKLIVLAGIFIQDFDSRADILVVADKINRKTLENLVRGLEAEIGKEIKYVALETAEFQYRLNMGDKLIRDILDYPHQVALDKLGTK